MKEGLNVVHVTGYVRSTPTLIRSKGSELLKFKLGVSDRRKKDDTYFTIYHNIDIVMWGIRGKNLYKVLKVGGFIYVGGKIRYSTYMSKSLKKEVTATLVEADKVLLLGLKPTR